MANRIVLGSHPTLGMGGFVSKPGINVLTAGKFDLMFSTSYEQLQIAQSGSFTIIGNGHNSIQWSSPISWNPLGFRPLVLLSCDEYEVYFQYLSDNSAHARRTLSNPESASNNFSNTDRTVYYIVTRTELP